MVKVKESSSGGPDFRQILGIKFFNGTAEQAVRRMVEDGGLIVVPAAPALIDLPKNPAYRQALVEADLAITDSALMVMTWNLIRRDKVRRVSGLEYLDLLLKEDALRTSTKVLWIMASEQSRSRNLEYLETEGISVPNEYTYIAPMYGSELVDEELLSKIRSLRPDHIVVTVGGGTQERLGLYLRKNLEYTPGIHCIGAAIAFLSGDQVKIPMWADRLYLGWLFRCVSQPSRYCKRYWEARKLIPMIISYRDRLPA